MGLTLVSVDVHVTSAQRAEIDGAVFAQKKKKVTGGAVERFW